MSVGYRWNARIAWLICAKSDRHSLNQVYSLGIREMERRMPARTIILKLNQQQLELIDRTIAQGAAVDRAALVQRAIREQSGKLAK
jgi:hypothetical protein